MMIDACRHVVFLVGSLVHSWRWVYGGRASGRRRETESERWASRMAKLVRRGNASVTNSIPGRRDPAHATGARRITVVQGKLTESRGETKRVYGPGMSSWTTQPTENAGPETWSTSE